MNEDNFKIHVWQIVAAIPEGKVATYGQVAKMAGNPNMARAVGRTMAKLPKGTKLPWHRVINAAGKISSPAQSEGYKEQRQRLEAEGIVFLNGKIKLSQYGWQP